MTPAILIVLIVSASCAAAGQVLFKLGSMNAVSATDFANWRIAGGLFFYGSGMVLWLIALSRAPLSLVYPFTIFTFICVGVAGIYVFDERPSSLTIAGWSIMLVGIIVVQIGSRA